MSRPEHQGPPELYYNEVEAVKYTRNSRIMHVQTVMAERALELLNLPANPDRPQLILDLGCGSALAGKVISKQGHLWVGMDISGAMLRVGMERNLEESSEGSDEEESEADDYEMDEDGSDDGSEFDDSMETPESALPPCSLLRDMVQADMGEGVACRPGLFDGCISISALQWLCHANRSHENPRRRLARLFTTLFGSLVRGARAVFQFYPETEGQIDLILGAATKAGFTGGVVVDYPHSTKAKKYYLCLMTGTPMALPAGRDGNGEDDEEDQVRVVKNQRHRRHANKGKPTKDRNWALAKKELRRKRGLEVRPDSKYTARKRRPKF